MRWCNTAYHQRDVVVAGRILVALMVTGHLFLRSWETRQDSARITGSTTQALILLILLVAYTQSLISIFDSKATLFEGVRRKYSTLTYSICQGRSGTTGGILK